MGKLENGPQGQLKGSVGNNVSYVLNGQNILRMKSKRTITLKSLSLKQQANCEQMRILGDFFQDILPILKVGFSLEAFGTAKNYHNLAISYNKLNALTGQFPNIEIDYPKVLMSFGSLGMSPVNSPEILEDGVKISWTYSPEQAGISATDQALIMISFPDLNRSMCFIYGAQRHAEFQLINLSAQYQNTRMESYLSFISDDRTAVSTSVYLGRLN